MDKQQVILPEGSGVPLPWLSTEEIKAAQPWAGTDNVILEITCRNMSIKDHRRCQILGTMPRTIASILLSGCCHLLFLGMIQFAHSMNRVLAINLITITTVLLVMSDIGMMFWGICVQIIAFRLNQAHKKGQLEWLTWSFTPERIYVETLSGKSFYPWAKIKKPVLFRGDLYIQRRSTLLGATLYMPRVAFADRDASKRFHTAIVALWKTHGDEQAIAPEVRAEFASSATA